MCEDPLAQKIVENWLVVDAGAEALVVIVEFGEAVAKDVDAYGIYRFRFVGRRL